MPSGVTRINGLACTAGTIYPLNSKLFLCTVKIANGTALDVSAEDDAVNEVVEQIVKEINPLAFFVANDDTGKIYLVMDFNASATDLQHRIRQIGADTPAVRTGATTFTYSVTSVGPNDRDISGTTVTDASSFTTA
jgi:hypothetical protein